MEYKRLRNGATVRTLELTEAEDVSERHDRKTGYKFELTVSGDKFELSAVPLEYGKSGNLSLFIDQTLILRGGDPTAPPPPLPTHRSINDRRRYKFSISTGFDRFREVKSKTFE